MRRTALFVAVLVVAAGVPLSVGAVGSHAAAGDAASGGVASVAAQDNETANETNGTAPGAQLAAVVSVQGAEVEGDLASRSFGLQMAAAKSNASKAAVLANQSGDLEERLSELRDRKQALIEAKQNGSISQARFRAEMASVAAELSTANNLLNRTTEESTELPAEALAAQGVSAESLQRLRAAAGNLSGPEISEIAREMGGPPFEGDGEGPPFGENDANETDDEGDSDVDLPDGVSVGDLPENVSVADLQDVSMDDLPENATVSDVVDEVENETETDTENDASLGSAPVTTGGPPTNETPGNSTTGPPVSVAWALTAVPLLGIE
ncbi:hypothetical protein [Halobacterium litoreum]|uniref:DUF5667 domain-containing protein n=1 Tax=Halobacterium litoreum TaxID=2039234 RepID=A0ABD5NFW4_9EURY|nr:hypothetical protein [Halobacterium litoreum]UHH13034.1 hypothetical protein LT972_12830 [Halobacterium litoreum]